jgi:hypothetical protein
MFPLYSALRQSQSLPKKEAVRLNVVQRCEGTGGPFCDQEATSRRVEVSREIETMEGIEVSRDEVGSAVLQ